MKKTYKHTFKDGDTVTLVVDFTFNPPKMKADKEIKEENIEEYKEWAVFLVNDIMDNLSKEQFLKAVSLGYEQFKKM